MNRSIDSRSDLYSLGVTLYQMLTGSLPFTASDPMEWVHCHIARRPTPPSERLAERPGRGLARSIMKLLAKTAEERYQTAAGAERDLRRCLAEWEAQRAHRRFPAGRARYAGPAADPREALRQSARGRDLARRFRPRRQRAARRSWCWSPDIPASANPRSSTNCTRCWCRRAGCSRQASSTSTSATSPMRRSRRRFRASIRPLLGKSDAELAGWRDALTRGAGPKRPAHGRPGPRAEAHHRRAAAGPGAPAAATRNSASSCVFRRFIGVFARPEHPLALFLDDLAMARRGDARSARGSVDPAGSAAPAADRRLPRQRGRCRPSADAQARRYRVRRREQCTEITLAPLGREHRGQLIADALRCEPERAAPLAQLVHEKTGGNPFFAIQFLSRARRRRIAHLRP